MYKACIFDLDGTLTDTLESLTYSVNETLKELKLKKITQEQCRSFVGMCEMSDRTCLVAGGGFRKISDGAGNGDIWTYIWRKLYISCNTIRWNRRDA